MASIGFTGLGKGEDGLIAERFFARLRQSERIVVAAICYRKRNDNSLEFLLVRTASGRWTFPKGAVDGDPTRAAAAAREAYEEAGVIGHIHEKPFTRYLHCKKNGRAHLVHAHLFRVRHFGRKHAEDHRCPTWFSAENAKRRLREGREEAFGRELERVVDTAVQLTL